MGKNIDKTIENLYEKRLNPTEEIYSQLNIENSEFKRLFNRAEQIEKMLQQIYDNEILEEFSNIHIQMQNIVSKHSFKYGMRLGAHLVRDL